jgi:hypothetical protein
MKCTTVCNFDAIHVEDFLARIDVDKCKSCGLCAAVFPTGAINSFRKLPKKEAAEKAAAAKKAKAEAAKAIAEVVPSEAVAAVLTGDGLADAYKAKFTAEVRQQDDKWLLSAELTPQAWTNLMENATAATRQIPVAEIAQLPPEVATNVVLTGCTPGFYYSLHCGATLTSIAPDAEMANLNVLCGADGAVEFPAVKKPSADAGFFKVVTNVK